MFLNSKNNQNLFLEILLIYCNLLIISIGIYPTRTKVTKKKQKLLKTPEGQKSKEEHTLLMRELNQRRSELKCQLAKFKEENIARLTANGELTKELIESYLQNK